MDLFSLLKAIRKPKVKDISQIDMFDTQYFLFDTPVKLSGGETKQFGENDTRKFDSQKHRWVDADKEPEKPEAETTKKDAEYNEREFLEAAYRLGAEAFSEGKTNIPALNKDLMRLLETVHKVGHGIAPMKEYLRGYTDASLGQSDKPYEPKTTRDSADKETEKFFNKLERKNQSRPFEGTIYDKNYTKLEKILGDLKEIKPNWRKVLKADGYMDLDAEYYGEDVNGRTILSISHWGKQNGDVMSDPRMEIAIDTENQAIEALTYENHYAGIYKTVYDDMFNSKKVNQQQKKEQNSFLSLWLKNIINQGHKETLSNEIHLRDNISSIYKSPEDNGKDRGELRTTDIAPEESKYDKVILEKPNMTFEITHKRTKPEGEEKEPSVFFEISLNGKKETIDYKTSIIFKPEKNVHLIQLPEELGISQEVIRLTTGKNGTVFVMLPEDKYSEMDKIYLAEVEADKARKQKEKENAKVTAEEKLKRANKILITDENNISDPFAFIGIDDEAFSKYELEFLNGKKEYKEFLRDNLNEIKSLNKIDVGKQLVYNVDRNWFFDGLEKWKIAKEEKAKAEEERKGEMADALRDELYINEDDKPNDNFKLLHSLGININNTFKKIEFFTTNDARRIGGNSTFDIKEKLKRIGCRWNPTTKVWWLPLNEDNLGKGYQILRKYDKRVIPKL